MVLVVVLLVKAVIFLLLMIHTQHAKMLKVPLFEKQ
nr:MAG TPA: hypothetical protein [Caudoviricetes sp.]